MNCLLNHKFEYQIYSTLILSLIFDCSHGYIVAKILLTIDIRISTIDHIHVHLFIYIFACKWEPSVLVYASMFDEYEDKPETTEVQLQW